MCTLIFIPFLIQYVYHIPGIQHFFYAFVHLWWLGTGRFDQFSELFFCMFRDTSTGIDADASKGETSPGYFNSKLVYSYRCGTIFPWEFPEISLAYSHIFLKGPSRSIIYGQIFWHPHPHPHIASPACIFLPSKSTILCFSVSFHLTIHFENAGNICNRYDI